MTKTIQVTQTCSWCDGDGYRRDKDDDSFNDYIDSGCRDCGGSGTYRSDTSHRYRHDKPKQDLRKGSGKVVNEYEVTSETCDRCSGDKYVIFWNGRFDQQRYEAILGRSFVPSSSPPTAAQIREADAFLRSNSRKETCDACHGTGFKLTYLRSRPYTSGW